MESLGEESQIDATYYFPQRNEAANSIKLIILIWNDKSLPGQVRYIFSIKRDNEIYMSLLSQ